MNVNANPLLEASDEELMRAYQLGEERAFSLLYERYSGKVYGYLRSKRQDVSDTQEVFQEVFLKLHRMRAKYRPMEPFAPWLYAMMRNVLIDHIRKMKAGIQPLFEPELFDSAQASSLSNGKNAEASDLSQVPGFHRLRTRQREALQLRYRDERSFSEIADHLDTSEANVRKLISRAIGKLRKNHLKEKAGHG